tara:strand:- start:18833 stop:19201 length:369 start_codon:yes stop_codon:yes gene_type:complete
LWQWFFIGAAMLALVGCVVSATATSVGALIGGTTLIGLAASGQQSFAFITGELVPMKVSIWAFGGLAGADVDSTALRPTPSCIFSVFRSQVSGPRSPRLSSCTRVRVGDGTSMLFLIRKIRG